MLHLRTPQAKASFYHRPRTLSSKGFQLKSAGRQPHRRRYTGPCSAWGWEAELSLESSRDPVRVREMFGGIAHRYDLLNHVLSANLDRGWRRAAARAVPQGSRTLLDLCGGTGDLTLELSRVHRESWVTCCDFSHGMLKRAHDKFGARGLEQRCQVLEADGLCLPFGDACFEAVTVAFGVRNFADMDKGLREIHRVLKPGGRLIVLEFSQPEGAIMSRLYGFYLRRLLPRLGGGVSGKESAYRYLARTIGAFPAAPLLAGQIRDAGFAACEWEHRSAGIVAIHTGQKA